MLTPEHCQAARARLQWSRDRLAAEAGIDVAAVVDFELEQKPVSAATIAALTGALEAAGVNLATSASAERWREQP